MMAAYEDRQEEEWERSRSLEYLIYCALTEEGKRVPIYQYMPLPGDPSPAEINEARKIKRKQKADYWKRRIMNMQEKGLINIPTKTTDDGKSKNTS